MKESGRILVDSKGDFVDLLREFGIKADTSMPDAELIRLFIDAVATHPELMMGTSVLINLHNRDESGFDGEGEMSDEGVKSAYYALRNYFKYADNEGHYGERYSNAVDPVTAIAEAVGSIAETGGKGLDLVKGRQDMKSRRQFGALDYAQQKEASKAAMIEAVVAQRTAMIESQRAKAESRRKTNMALIIGGSVLAVGIIVAVVVMAKKKRK
jgi:hypothetical protein